MAKSSGCDNESRTRAYVNVVFSLDSKFLASVDDGRTSVRIHLFQAS